MQVFINWCVEHKTALIIVAVALAVIVVIIIGACVYRHSERYKLFKFLRYKIPEGPPHNRQKHPKLIVEVTKDEYGFMGLTESEKTKNKDNIPIQNPQKGNTRKSHIRKELRHSKKSKFYKSILTNYKLSRKDKRAVKKYLKTRKKK